MPQKIYMNISNNNANIKQYLNFQKNEKIHEMPKASTALNSGMIARIHNIKPGCSSCGRH